MKTSSQAQSPSSRWEIIAVSLILAYYLGRLLFFAWQIAPGIPPDEKTHVGISLLHSKTLGWIGDSSESFRYGLVTRVPFLYHMVMGKLLALRPATLDVTRYVRLWNVALAMVTAVSAYALATRLLQTTTARLLFAILFTNTLMLTFLSASVSYDNLVNCLAVVSILLLTVSLQQPRPRVLLALLIALGLGCLTKITFAPLALLVGAAYLIGRRGRVIEDLKAAATSLSTPSGAAVGVALLLVVAANLWLYGGNLIRYGRPVPDCSQVLEHEECMENRIYARNWVVGQFREGRMTFDQAMQSTSLISHPGDREHALRLLRHERNYQQAAADLLNPLDYMIVVWQQAIRPTVFGIQAHLSMLRSSRQLLPYDLVLLFGMLLYIRRASTPGPDRILLLAALITLAYFVFLVGYVNYTGYLATHAPLLGVQGRYVFPVLATFYLLVSSSFADHGSRFVRVSAAIAIAMIFLAGDLPFFLSQASAEWYGTAGP